MADKEQLIWAEDAKRHLIALAVGHHSETLHIDMILNAILYHTTAVDPVHAAGACYCLECKYWEEIATIYGKDTVCTNQGCMKVAKLPNDFCSRGEMKTNMFEKLTETGIKLGLLKEVE